VFIRLIIRIQQSCKLVCDGWSM